MGALILLLGTKCTSLLGTPTATTSGPILRRGLGGYTPPSQKKNPPLLLHRVTSVTSHTTNGKTKSQCAFFSHDRGRRGRCGAGAPCTSSHPSPFWKKKTKRQNKHLPLARPRSPETPFPTPPLNSLTLKTRKKKVTPPPPTKSHLPLSFSSFTSVQTLVFRANAKPTSKLCRLKQTSTPTDRLRASLLLLLQ